MTRMLMLRLARALGTAALGSLLAVSLGAPPAAAQFVCVGNAGGATVGPATAAGAGAIATGGGVACGTSANAVGGTSGNSAFGNQANAGSTPGAGGVSTFNTAVGYQSNASATGGTANTAVGAFANALGGTVSANVAIGSRNPELVTSAPNASGFIANNIAIGTSSNASGHGNLLTVANNIAIGFNANANGDNSSNLAIGVNSTASGNSVAYGNGANATFANSAAFGNGATATRDNQQVFGTATNTYTISGVASAASKAAQSGPTQIVTSDSGGNLATSTLAGLGLASSADIGAINSQLGAINARLDDLTLRSNKAYTGVAMAFAMAGVPTLMPNESFAVTMNWGTFQSANGLALNAAVRVDNHVQLNAGFGYGPDQRLAGGRVGVRVGW